MNARRSRSPVVANWRTPRFATPPSVSAAAMKISEVTVMK